jgi:hypothetical protein
MTEKQKLTVCITALRMIALSYTQRIDKSDTPPYVFADEILKFVGEDISWSSYDEDDKRLLFQAFRQWKKDTGATGVRLVA